MLTVKHKLKRIWRSATAVSVLIFIVLVPVFLSVGAELIPAIILAAVSGLVLWHACILAAVRIWVPQLSEHVSPARVERVMDDVEVESTPFDTGDSELNEYVDDYAKARDFWGKTVMMVLVAGFLALLYWVFGVP